MEPSTPHDRDGLSGAIDPPAVLLVELPRFDERDTTACIDLLTAAPAADEKLLIVSVTETIGKTHRRWDDHVGEHPDEFAVVSASFAEDGPGGTNEGVDGASEANWLVSHHIDDPGDLTGLGVTISSQLEEWAEDEEQVVVCVRSLTTMLQYVGSDELVRFLGELRRHLEAAGAIAHYHVDPQAMDEQSLAAIRSVVGGVVVAVDGDSTVELLE
jgi:hypothetical protein